MASHDYYSSYANTSPNRNDAPLPPAPGNQSAQSISPVSSPFDDRNRYDYPSSQQNLAQHPAPMGYDDTSYHGSSSHHQTPYHSDSRSSDPFADQNAIPLKAHGEMGGGPRRYNTDLEGSLYPAGPVASAKKKGWLSGRVTWVCYILTVVQIAVFVGEIIKMGVLTGSPIQTKPQFNIMIGPSPWVLINMGARYPPCMHNVRGVTDKKFSPNVEFPGFNGEGTPWPCPNNTKSENPTCTLSELCGMGGVPIQARGTDFRDRSKEPDQWWRFIVPIFLHAGIIHIGFNMLLQMTLGRDMEKEIGSIRFTLVYFAAGIFGFVLGGNYAAQNVPSVGASGSLFGILALVFLDLLYNWSTRRSPVKDLLFLLLDIAIAFVLGLLPGLDNFSHIGGFLMGLVLGVCLLHSPAVLRQRIGVDEPPYSTVDTAGGKDSLPVFVKKPLGFFKGRKPLWWAWWLVRVGSLIAVFIGFILLLKNFYVWRNECSWCYRLTCLPIKNWCDIGNEFFTEKPATETSPAAQATSTAAAMLARHLFES